MHAAPSSRSEQVSQAILDLARARGLPICKALSGEAERTSIMSYSDHAAFARGFSGFRFTHRARPYDAAERRAALDRLDMLATVFDTAFILPGTKVRFGVESLLRLVPGVGDVIASARIRPHREIVNIRERLEPGAGIRR